VVDLYGAVTAVSLHSPLMDLSQSCTATMSHSQTNVLTPTDAACVDVVNEVTESNDITAAAAVVVCLLTCTLFHQCVSSCIIACCVTVYSADQYSRLSLYAAFNCTVSQN